MPSQMPIYLPTRKIGETVDFALGTPWDLTGYQAIAQLKDDQGNGNLVANFALTLEVNPKTGLLGRVRLRLSSTQTGSLQPGMEYAFDVRLSSGSFVWQSPDIRMKFGRRISNG